MQRPPRPEHEAERLRALHRLGVLDTGAERAYDDLVKIAAGICGVPMGAVSLIDAERQWFKARLGIEDAQTSRETSFCAHAILDPSDVLVVADATRDERFHDNPMVAGGPRIRFYAGAPLVDADGHAVGALCVMDAEPRQLQDFQREALRALSRQVWALLELRQVSRELALQLDERGWYETQLRNLNGELELQNAELNEQVRLDALTRLANRRALGAALEQVLADGSPFCVALMDIDHFKAVNDTHGHAAGDAVLVEVAAALRASAGGHGLLARYGGEEFAWLWPGEEPDQARLQCEYMREAVAFASASLPVTISIGLAAGRGGDSVAEVMQRADQALYAAKRNGRNRVEQA